MGRSVASRGPKAKSLGRRPFPPSLLLFPFPSSPAMGRFPSNDRGVVAPAGSWQSGRAASWSEEEVSCRREGPLWGSFFVKGFVVAALHPIMTRLSRCPSLSRCPVLGCQSVVAPASVVSRPGGVSRVRGGSACGPSTLRRSEVAVLEIFGSVGGDATFKVPGRGPGGRVVTVVSERVSTEICVRLPYKIHVRAVVDCSCCCVACVASLVTRCVHAVVARSTLDSLAVVFPIWRMIAGKSRRSLRHLHVVVVGLVLTGCELWSRCIAWLPGVLWVSQNGALVVLVKVLPRIVLLSLLAECAVWLGCILVRFSQDGSWRFGVEVALLVVRQALFVACVQVVLVLRLAIASSIGFCWRQSRLLVGDEGYKPLLMPLSPFSPLLPFPLFSGDGEVPLRRSGDGDTGGLMA
ncbi:hypothetical protein Taro_040995 [Colocasia esculenta]|uniref:SWIM-type domain-containing protein n=1 Tax=Colocasia esculenta TaxID=4460 RepID=A0A843WD83_COLES|nr:hypothetical protein [Colocasia esculenta]